MTTRRGVNNDDWVDNEKRTTRTDRTAAPPSGFLRLSAEIGDRRASNSIVGIPDLCPEPTFEIFLLRALPLENYHRASRGSYIDSMVAFGDGRFHKWDRPRSSFFAVSPFFGFYLC